MGVSVEHSVMTNDENEQLLFLSEREVGKRFKMMCFLCSDAASLSDLQHYHGMTLYFTKSWGMILISYSEDNGCSQI